MLALGIRALKGISVLFLEKEQDFHQFYFPNISYIQIYKTPLHEYNNLDSAEREAAGSDLSAFLVLRSKPSGNTL